MSKMKSERRPLLFALCLFSFVASAAENEIAKWDPRMADASAVITNGVKWLDGRTLPLEGRAFANGERFYDRLPSNVTAKVNGGVRYLKHHSAGMLFRFKTDSNVVNIRWKPFCENLSMAHMNANGTSGIDVYRWDAAGKSWRFVTTGFVTLPKYDGAKKCWRYESGETKPYFSASVPWKPGETCLVNLPLYNGIDDIQIGVSPKATIEAPEPWASGVTKPVVFYGTSITQGGCCTRPGMNFVSIVGRQLNVPTVNLGFSGSGWMEFEMSEHLAAVDASCYVLDCLWNMNMGANAFSNRYEEFIRNLRAKRPDVPIVMAEQCDVFCGPKGDKNNAVRALYEKLIAEGWKNLVYLPKEGMYPDDLEGTVDGCHPNDYGMMHLAKAFGKAVKDALKLR